ncbi:MAG: zinc ABC transporter substrate-binding protein [Hyphomicrobium sp.]|nr:zinc ABC transporter substrate-binding protein [Hyphomicrobium sp.]
MNEFDWNFRMLEQAKGLLSCGKASSNARILLSAAVFGSCTVLTPAAVAGESPTENSVVTTIKPIHGLVAEVLGNEGAPRLLVDGAASPHTYALKPSDARALNAAKVFFRVSPDVEPFTRKIVAAIPPSVTVVTLAETPGLVLLKRRSGNAFETHDHSAADEHGHADHGHGDHHNGHRHHEKDDANAADGRIENNDGHVWLDPENAKAMTRAIRDALSAAYPDKKDIFQRNADATIARLDALSTEVNTMLEPVKGRPFVVFHDAYQYFEARFGVPAIGSITVSPEVQPSAKRLTAIREKIRASNAHCVFAEPQFQAKLVATVTEGTGARAGTLDPEGATVAAGPGAYDRLIRGLAANLKDCLSAGS